MDNKEIEQQWSAFAEKLLLGKKIVKIEYMSEDEVKSSMWGNRPICLQLDDGSWIYPQMDDEGNDGGALYYHDAKDQEKNTVLPVI